MLFANKNIHTNIPFTKIIPGRKKIPTVVDGIIKGKPERRQAIKAMEKNRGMKNDSNPLKTQNAKLKLEMYIINRTHSQ